MDDFREWLSDNLRYFMLGFGILALIVLIFFGIRLISNLTTDKTDATVETEVIAEEEVTVENEEEAVTEEE